MHDNGGVREILDDIFVIFDRPIGYVKSAKAASGNRELNMNDFGEASFYRFILGMDPTMDMETLATIRFVATEGPTSKTPQARSHRHVTTSWTPKTTNPYG